MADANRGRLEWHCRRGMRELDIVLMRFMRVDYDRSAPVHQKAFEDLLAWQDPDIVDLLAGRLVSQDPDLNHVIERLLEHD